MQSISKRFSVLKHTLKQTTRIKLHQAGQQNALLKAIKEQESRKVYRNVKQLMESTVVNVNLTDSGKSPIFINHSLTNY
jgi:glycine cleavage system H lipoate-binding protein